MIILSKDGNRYTAQPEPDDIPFYDIWETTLTLNSTASEFHVGYVKCIGPVDMPFPWDFHLLGLTGEEIEPEVGESVRYTVREYHATCCERGRGLTWRTTWFPYSWYTRAPNKTGWCEGIGCTCAGCWNQYDRCPGCGAELPEPGPWARKEVMEVLLGLLKVLSEDPPDPPR